MILYELICQLLRQVKQPQIGGLKLHCWYLNFRWNTNQTEG